MAEALEHGQHGGHPPLFRVTRDSAGKPAPLPGIFPDNVAPIIRNTDGDRKLTTGALMAGCAPIF